MPLLQTTCPSSPLSLPDEGVHEIYAGRHVIAGTAVQGGGQAVPVAGGYRISGRWTFGDRRQLRSRSLRLAAAG